MKKNGFFTLLRIIFRAMVIAGVCGWRFVPLLFVKKQNRSKVKIASVASRVCHDLGSTFLKFGQVIASSPGLVGVETANIFRSCLDTGPSISKRALISAIGKAAGCPISKIYKDISLEPIATASIAAVHSATTLSGNRVAIKVRRPGIKNRVNDDIKILRWLLQMAARFGKQSDAAEILELVDDFERNIQDELDLRIEQVAIDRMNQQLIIHGFSEITVPKTYPELSDDRVLVMEMLDGVPIDDIKAIKELEIDPTPMVDSIIRMWLITSVADGEFHGDCHAGNILVLRDKRIGLLDLGIIGKIDEKTQLFLVRLLEGSVGVDNAWHDVADFLYKQYRKTLLDGFGITLEEFPAKLRDLLGPLLTAPFGQNSLAHFLEQASLENKASTSSSSVEQSTEHAEVSTSFDQGFFLWIKQLVFFERYARLHKRYQSIANYAAEILPMIPSSQLYGSEAISLSSSAIDGIHHIGHLVNDLESGLHLYRRLGFTMTIPAVPAVSLKKGDSLTPLGAANSHADFADQSFIEVVSVAGSSKKIPNDTKLVPIQVPENVMDKFLKVVNRTISKLHSCLERFEGTHIMVFRSDNVYAQAMRLSEEGIAHSGVTSTKREADDVRFLELEEPTPEGRLAIAGRLPVSNTHKNGALGLVESILCVSDSDLPAITLRYQTYLNTTGHLEDNRTIFDLGSTRLIIVADSVLETILPGERPNALPAFVGYVIKVKNIEQTHQLLTENGFTPQTTKTSDVFVSSKEALGTAIIFRQNKDEK
jgi:predicted unusual protein kinase regulating ubiquinone biosynthesis (AarF/ABC1/UbiB family)